MAETENEEFAKYSEKADRHEGEIKLLQDELLALSDPAKMVSNGIVSDEVEQLRNQNQKLNYQKNVLKRQLEKEESSSQDFALDVRGLIEDIFGLAVRKALPEVPEPAILVTPSSKFADYQFNSAMSIAQTLTAQTGKKVNPREVAEKILKKIPSNSFFEKVEIAGPGFINIFLEREFVKKQIQNIILNGVKPPKVTKKRVIVDFSSPNIAKEMHVGHLRSTIIGESLCRLYEWVGHDVLRLSHLGDWGTQFGMLIAHLVDKFPNLLKEKPCIEDLQLFYRDSKVRFDNEEDFKKRAYECVIKLQSRDPFHIKAWKIIYDISMDVNNRLYEKLDVTAIPRGESYYQDRMVKLVEELTRDEKVEVDEGGRKVMFVPGFDVPLMITKSDGGFTYDTSDLACIRNRLHEEHGDWLVYVVDSGQGGHLETIFKAAEVLGWSEKGTHRVDHVNFGVVLGEDKKKFKTRSGRTVRLRELLDEGVKRVEAKLIALGRDKELTREEMEKVKESVAYGCIRYADLSHNRTHDYVFSFDKMLDDRGNTAAYLLYAFTRIRSIARTAKVSTADLERSAQDPDGVVLEHPAEWKLAKCILRFTEVISRVLQDYMLHSLCDYIYELTTTYTEFYDKCYCLEKDKATGQIVKVNMHRLLLCEATASIISAGFHILGIKPLEKM